LLIDSQAICDPHAVSAIDHDVNRQSTIRNRVNPQSEISNPQFTMLKPLVFLAALTPFLWLLFRTFTDRLSANPIEDLTLTTGIWALRFLLITLAITPLRRVTGWNRLIQYRRMLGLFAFFYATLHLAIYVVDVIAVEGSFTFAPVLKDIVKRPFITMGMTAFVLMVPLAITSTKGWIRRLGRRWQLLHRIIYISATAAVVHFIWKVKVAVGEPVYYAVILAVLLGFRLIWALKKNRRLRWAALSSRHSSLHL
jgi:sulfoxide reductase heme-binding subunit YedZ